MNSRGGKSIEKWNIKVIWESYVKADDPPDQEKNQKEQWNTGNITGGRRNFKGWRFKWGCGQGMETGDGKGGLAWTKDARRNITEIH